MKNQKILLIDMDGVLVDLHSEIQKWYDEHPNIAHLYKNSPDRIPGLFRNPAPMDGAVEAVNKLHQSNKYDMFIATTAPWGNPESFSDKRYWIEQHFGRIFYKKMFITHRKDMLMGDYLIDDRTANGAGEFRGELLQFGWNYERKEWNKYSDWNSILGRLLN